MDNDGYRFWLRMSTKDMMRHFAGMTHPFTRSAQWNPQM